jgi:hypothetical protein
MSPEASAPPAKVGQQAKLPEEKTNPEQASLSNLDDILNAKLMEDNVAAGQATAAPVAKVPAAPAKAKAGVAKHEVEKKEVLPVGLEAPKAVNSQLEADIQSADSLLLGAKTAQLEGSEAMHRQTVKVQLQAQVLVDLKAKAEAKLSE